MIVGLCKIYLSAQWVNSLKEKRMIVKSIIDKVKNKFNVSIAEVEKQDMHKFIVIGFACVSNSSSHINSIIDNVVNFIEKNASAIVDDVQYEISPVKIQQNTGF